MTQAEEQRTAPTGAWVQVSTLLPYNVYRGVLVGYRDLDVGPTIVLAAAEIRGPQRDLSEEPPPNWIPITGMVALPYHDNTLGILWKPDYGGKPPAAVLTARAEGYIQ